MRRREANQHNQHNQYGHKAISVLAAILLSGSMLISTAFGYPIDGYEHTGITRLEGYQLAQEGEVRGRDLPEGAQWPLEWVDIRLTDRPDFTIPPSDPELEKKIRGFLGHESNRYGITLLDLTDLKNPRYGAHRPEARYNPGSVGKLMIGLGVFQALADTYPDDTRKRMEILRTSQVVSDRFIQSDHHVVPFWEPGQSRIQKRPLRIGDTANLFSYLDWMLSASSNSAASMCGREGMLIRNFGREYPVSQERIDRFFSETPKSDLSDLLSATIHEPVAQNGLDPEELRQGGLLTWRGKQLVPGTTSFGNAGELMRFLVKLEKGELVDEFSSREFKRLLYMTQRRIRYAYSPELHDHGVYFKSGSLYKCRSGGCGKYKGDVYNMMNSVAIVESPPDRNPRLHYMVVVMSNVLRKNSAWIHSVLGGKIHKLMESLHPIETPPAPDVGPDTAPDGG